VSLFAPLFARADVPVGVPELARALDPVRTLAEHEGHFGLHQRAPDGTHFLARDRLGVHKLFFSVVGSEVHSANYLIELLRAGHACADVWSVPPGHLLRLQPAERRQELVSFAPLTFGTEESAEKGALAWHAERLRAALRRTFRLLARHCAGRPVYVTLSGGIDSSLVTLLAREYLPEVVAVTFALRAPRESGPGADLFCARRVARALGVPHLEVRCEPDEVLELLDEVLVYGQDARDFNVHCGLVNAALARALGARHARGPRPVVLSGDTLNELLADYAAVPYRGREYFRLPDLSRGRVRRFLVGGLDVGDREVGLFARHGLETLQPYALCARELAALPAELACAPGAKARLVAALVGTRLPDFVLARPKVRAQVAVEGEPGGTLALLVERGIDQEELTRRFARLCGLERAELAGLVRAGHYRHSPGFPPAPGARRRYPQPTGTLLRAAEGAGARGVPGEQPA